MANSAKPIKEERVWDDPLPIDVKIPVAASSSNETLLVNQAMFLQQNPDYIYTYLKDMHYNNKRVTAYTVGFMLMCVGVTTYSIPYVLPDMTALEQSNVFLLTGVIMIVLATIISKVKI